MGRGSIGGTRGFFRPQASPFAVWVHADSTTGNPLTNQLQAEDFLGSSTRHIMKVDLSPFTQVRLATRVSTASASPNSPKILAKYRPTFDGSPANWLGIGVSEVSVSLAVAGAVESAWVDLAAGARADVLWTVLQSGGDGVADPVIGHTALYFR